MPLFLPTEAHPGEPPLELLPALQARDDDAWMEFEHWATPLVQNYCHKRHVSDADADSITQQVLLAVVEHIDTFRPDDQPHCFRRWLHCIACHKLVDLRRSHQPRLIDPDCLDLTPDPRQTKPTLSPSPQPDAGRQQKALDQVRPEFRASSWQAFEMVVFQGWTAAEAGEALGMQPNAVRVAKSRIIKRLREVLTQADVAPDGTIASAPAADAPCNAFPLI